MFGVTFVNKTNADLFLRPVSEHALAESDAFIGIYDIETDVACGVAAVSVIAEEDLSLNFIFVEPGWRRQGAGKALLAALIEYAKKADFSQISCAFAVGSDETDRLSGFLLASGFEKEGEDPVYSIKASDVWIGKQGIKAGDPAFDVIPLSKAGGKTWKGFEHFCAENRDFTNLIISDLENRLYYDENISSMAVNPDTGKCHGALLFKSGEDYVTPLVFYMGGTSPGKTALKMLVYSYNVLKTNYVHDPYIYMSFPDERAMTLFKKFCKSEPVVSGKTLEFKLTV